MLHNLDSILKETLLLTSEPNLTSQDSGDIICPRIQLTREWKNRPDDERPIWEYQPRSLAKLEELTVRHRLMDHEQVRVCDRIEWGPVSVVSAQGEKYELPLTERFRLRTYWLPVGEVPEGSTGFWQLPANLHSSYQHVFGYEVDIRTGELVPFDKKALDHPELMWPVDDHFDLRKEKSRLYICYVTPLRIVVCVTMACFAERNDFEPAGALYAARIRPNIMVMANMQLTSIDGAITIERPAQAAHCHDHTMTANIGAALFTDRNATEVLPYWDNFFDYYDTTPKPSESFVAASDRGERTSPNGASAWDAYHHAYLARDVHKVARQGEFDNLHLAPKMTASQKVIEKYPHFAESLQNITMAPFCIHDCLHTHWRWGLNQSAKHVLGWGGTLDRPGEPYSQANAPGVPPNQTVTISLLGQGASVRGFRYSAAVKNPQAGRWQVIFHHGSAYGIDASRGLGKVLPTMLLQAPFMQFDPTDIELSWPMFYWHLRFSSADVGAEAHERISLGHRTLAKLRAL